MFLGNSIMLSVVVSKSVFTFHSQMQLQEQVSSKIKERKLRIVYPKKTGSLLAMKLKDTLDQIVLSLLMKH